MNYGIGSYISGLTNMASSMSVNIGPSFIEAYCFNLKNFKEEFANHFEVSLDEVKLNKTNITLREVLSAWLGNDELVDSLLYWIKLKIGETGKAYEVKKNKLLDLISNSEGGNSIFYIVDDAYFVEIDDYMLCFILGNNE